jgi:signal transduction histidine kinase
VELSAYRISQEALTNTLKHAGPTPAGVTVRYYDGAVQVELVDDGQGPPPRVPGSAGHPLGVLRPDLAATNQL